MKRAVVTAFCDIHYAKDQTLEPASHPDTTLRLGDVASILDLCEPCLDELMADLQAYMALGKAARAARKGMDRRSSDYYDALRVWAKAQGIALKVDAKGRTVYPRDVKDRFDNSQA